MSHRSFRLFLCLAIVRAIAAHGVPTPVPTGPLHVQGSVIADSNGQVIPLRGAEMPGLNLANPSPSQLQTIAAMNAIGFGVLRLHWNFNTVRLPVSSAVWRRDGQSYLDRVGGIVKLANDAGLIAVLSDCEDARAGVSVETGLPVPDTVTFWQAWAAYFKGAPHVIFDLFNEPSVRNVPGRVPGQRQSADWIFWRDGGTGADGRQYIGMQALVNVIRSTGASQIIAVSSFHDSLDFQGFTPDFFLKDSNVIYEAHPYFDHALTDDDRDRNFGLLTQNVPVYAGQWGLDLTEDTPACRSVPGNSQQTTDLLFQTLAYFDRRGISWTAAFFDNNSLIRSVSTFERTQLNSAWTCGVITDPEPGMGEVVLLWMTGDPGGFGALLPELVANAAGGPSGPVAPGEIVKIFGFLFGSSDNVAAAFDQSGNLPITVAQTRVFFDGDAVPLFAVGPFEITAQVPYSVSGKKNTIVRIGYQEIPSNTITLPVVETAPGIVTALGTNQALALNQDGTLNSFSNPAQSGSVLVIFATGYGLTSPAAITGRAAQSPYGVPIAPISVRIGDTAAEVLYAAETPGFVGLLQVNARVSALGGEKSRTVPVLLKIGQQSSITAGVWVL